MSKAELCPVCNGEGKLKVQCLGTWQIKESQCHGCSGLGWVEVSSDTYQCTCHIKHLITGVTPCLLHG